MASALHTVEATGVARFMRESLFAYPVAETVHIAGLALLFGSIAIVDVRLLGLGQRIPLASLVRFAIPWSLAGFAAAALSGSLMLAAHAEEFLTLPLFWLKMTLIVTAGANALLLHRGALRDGPRLDAMSSTPARLKTAAVISLALWLGVIACGRMLAYL